jgi:negative regulator of genetic competence, sporulation and motility
MLLISLIILSVLYIITLILLSKKIPQIKEFADNICTSKLTAAKIREYGKTIISDNAIDSLAKLSQDF